MTRGVRLPRGQRKQQLLNAALHVFVKTGYHAASMDEIASYAGVTKPVLYQHFGSKRELYLAVLEAGSEGFLATIRQALESTTNNEGRVAATVAAYVEFVKRADATYRLLFESDLVNSPDVRDKVRRVDDICASMLSEVIAQDTGLSAGEATLLAYGMLGMAQSAAKYFLTTDDELTTESAEKLLGALSWKGISGFPKSHPPKPATSAESE
jgi:AcrR family transcriptional regulator